MDQEFGHWCPLETRKWPWLTGITFSVIVIFQCFELPDGSSLLSTPFAQKALVAGNGSLELDAVSSGNMNGLNGTESDYEEEKAGGGDNGLISEDIARLNRSSGRVDNRDKASSPDQFGDRSTNLTLDGVGNLGMRPVPEEAERSFPNENATLTSEDNLGNSDPDNSSIVLVLPPKDLSPIRTLPMNGEPTILTPGSPVEINASVVGKDATGSLHNDGSPGELGNRIAHMPPSSETAVPEVTIPPVVTISDMNKLLLQSRSFPTLVGPRWSSPVDQELLHAKSEILNAPISSNDPSLYAPLYRNVSMFKRSYELMEETLKVYIYKEGEKPILHQPVLQGIYASEGWFMKLLEANKKFVTKDPKKAHLFYLPFGSRNLEETLYVPNSHSFDNLIQFLKNYLNTITAKYPFWNRTNGADHFLVACHDWAPAETKQHMANCIRALCNSDVKEGFIFGKDVSLPETFVRSPQRPLRDLGGKPPSQRSILAFFAGNMHGYVRPILLQQWGDKDPDMRIFGRMPKRRRSMNYIQSMKSSKYCICPKGYEVNSPRVVEAIFYECVPVIISDNFVPPFFSILNWESFAVFVLEKDIPNLKNILLSIPEKKYHEMQMRVKRVQQHFLWHPGPVKYDLFHMILHSIWCNRVFLTSETRY